MVIISLKAIIHGALPSNFILEINCFPSSNSKFSVLSKVSFLSKISDLFKFTFCSPQFACSKAIKGPQNTDTNSHSQNKCKIVSCRIWQNEQFPLALIIILYNK